MQVNHIRIIDNRRFEAPSPGALSFTAGKKDDRTQSFVIARIDFFETDGYTMLDIMRKVVGGSVEHVHIGASRHRPHIVYDGWVNESGWLDELPAFVRLRVARGVRHEVISILGPLVITAGNSLTGETIALEPAEIEDVVLHTVNDDLPIVAITER